MPGVRPEPHADALERGRTGAAEMERRLRPLLEQRPLRERLLLLAALERGAAARYRAWAEEAEAASERRGLRACGAREETIAEAAEGLARAGPEASRALVAPLLPELRAHARAVFAGRERREQLALQAAGERVGARAWRTLAWELEAAAGETLERCAALEEESAAFLEALLATPAVPRPSRRASECSGSGTPPMESKRSGS